MMTGKKIVMLSALLLLAVVMVSFLVWGLAGPSGITPLRPKRERIESDYNVWMEWDSVFDRDVGLRTPLHWAATMSDHRLMKSLIARGAEIDPQDENHETPLHWASRDGDIEAVRLLLLAGADVDGKARLPGDAPLQLAVRRLWVQGARNSLSEAEATEMVRLLLLAGADPNVQGDSPVVLADAVAEGAMEMVKLLLIAGADPRLDCVLHTAVRAGSSEMVLLLLAHGADVKEVDSIGKTALHYAVLDESLPVARILLQHGADPTVANNSGETPLGLAKRLKMQEMAELLATPLDKLEE